MKNEQALLGLLPIAEEYRERSKTEAFTAHAYVHLFDHEVRGLVIFGDHALLHDVEMFLKGQS